MRPKEIMLIAGEPSGDLLGAELVNDLREELTRAEIEYTHDLQPLHTGLEPRFFGAGGPRMAAAGVELAFDLTEHSVIGLPTPKQYWESRRRFHQLLHLALQRQPDAIIGIDYNYFNLRFARAVRNYVSRRNSWFLDWHPRLVKYISPQVWASRESRAYQIARDYDLLLCLFPFEKEWYARRVPQLRVEFVGHPLLDRFAEGTTSGSDSKLNKDSLELLLLPGSRKSELRRHLPIMLDVLKTMRERLPRLKAKVVSPDESLAELAKSLGVDFKIQIGNLPEALERADAAIASTGTVTMECALFGVPTATLYRAPLLGLGRSSGIITTKWFTLPNIIANEEIYPEFIQSAATPENIARASLELLQNESRRTTIRAKLAKIVSSLGGAGASRRAAQAITTLLEPKPGGSAENLPALTFSH